MQLNKQTGNINRRNFIKYNFCFWLHLIFILSVYAVHQMFSTCIEQLKQINTNWSIEHLMQYDMILGVNLT